MFTICGSDDTGMHHNFCCKGDARLEEPKIQFKKLQNSHLNLLHQWLNQPRIAQVWDGPVSIDQVLGHYFSRKDKNVQRFIPYIGNVPIGFVQSYWATKCGDGWWENEHDDGAVGIDFFMGASEYLGKGLGTEMIKEFVRMLAANPAVTKIISDPTPDNVRSIRCLENVGFQRITEIQTPDGRAILMEMQVSH